MSYFGQQYPLYVPPSGLEPIKVRMTTTTQTTTMETEQLTKTLVVFGATGDLSRKKIIPALETLHNKGLLDNTKVIGCARSAESREEWLERLGRSYESEFLDKLFYHKCDLGDPKSLESIPVEGDSTFFLSVPP